MYQCMYVNMCVCMCISVTREMHAFICECVYIFVSKGVVSREKSVCECMYLLLFKPMCVYMKHVYAHIYIHASVYI